MGLLAATLGPGPTLWINVGSYLFIAGTLLLIRRPFNTERSEPTGDRTRLRHTLSDIRDGVGFLRRHEVLWPLTMLTLGSSMTTGAALGLVVVYGVRHLGLAEDDARMGLLYTAGAVGALGAAVILPQLVKRAGRGRIVIVGFVLRALLLASLAVAPTLLVGVLLLLLWQGVTTVTTLNVISLRQQVTPDRLQGRVNTTSRMLVAVGQSGGAALGGLLADQFSIQVTYLLMALVVGLTALLAALSPVRRLDTAALQRHMAEADAYAK